MAGPFHYFRKHQKPLIAAAAVLCMVIFVFSDALVGIIRNAAGGSGGGRSAKSMVATWDGGSLNGRELAVLRSRRFFLSGFLRRLEITGAQRVIADGGSPTKPSIPDFILPENTTAKAVDLSVVTSRVFADLANQTGMRVSDKVINHYLHEAGFHRVGGDELVEMLKDFRVADRQATANILFESLRENLLSHTYQNGTAFISQTILPEQRWEDWRRVNDRRALEVAILPVSGMIADVPEPSKTERLEFYEEHKVRLGKQLLDVMGAERQAPNPGFAQPRKVRLQYLLGDVFSWSEKAQGMVTDAEIEDYYQRNKRSQFVQTDVNMPKSDDSSEASEVTGSDEQSSQDAVSTEDESTDDAEDQVRYLPLEEVGDQIRRQLATEKAVNQLKTTVDRLFIQLRKVYNEEYGEKQALAEAQGSEPPAPPQLLTSLGTLAKDYGLIFEETPLLSGLQLARESLVGKAMDARTGRASVTQRMLGKQALYDPLIANDIDGNWYLVIKVEDIPMHIPQLDEIQSEVIDAWKVKEATKLALKKAEAWATEVQESSDPFADFFNDKQLADNSGVEIVTTDLFSKFTFGATPAAMQQGPRLGDAPPLVGVGPDFMTGAFELKQTEVKVLQNYDQSQVYVARIHQREMSEEQLRKLFLAEANSWFGARFSTMARWQQFQRKVFHQLTTRVGLTFEEGWGQDRR